VVGIATIGYVACFLLHPKIYAKKTEILMKTEKLKVVCLGDSLTGPSPGETYLDKYIKWADLLQLALESALGRGRVEVLNQGKAGDTSAGVLQHLDERLLRWQPDLTVIMISANNFSKDHAGDASDAEVSARFKEDLKEIVGRAKGAGIRVLLLQYPDPKAENMEKVWTHGNKGNPVIAEVGREEDVPVISLKSEFDAAAQKQPLACLASPVDGIHLNPGGELVLTRAVVEKLRALGWIPAFVSPLDRK